LSHSSSLISLVWIVCSWIKKLISRTSNCFVSLEWSASNWRYSSVMGYSYSVTRWSSWQALNLHSVITFSQFHSNTTFASTIRIKNMVIESCWNFNASTFTTFNFAWTVNHNLASFKSFILLVSQSNKVIYFTLAWALPACTTLFVC